MLTARLAAERGHEGPNLSKYLPDRTERAWVPLGNSVMLVARKYGPDKTCHFGNIIFEFAAVIRERPKLSV